MTEPGTATNTLADGCAYRRDIAVDQVLAVSRQLPIVAGTYSINSLVATVYTAVVSGALEALLLAAPLQVIAFFALARWRRTRHLPRPSSVSDRALRTAFAQTALGGVLWGGFCAALYPVTDDAGKFILVCVAAGMAGGSAAVLYVLPRAVPVYSLSCTLPITLVAIASHGTGFLPLLLLSLVYVGFLSYAADISFEQFSANIRLKIENERLLGESRSAYDMKTEFIANMSHELRTPLNAIIGFSEMIKKQMLGPIGSTKYSEYATDIHESGLHLLQIVNDILDMSKIDAGRFSISRNDIDVTGIVASATRFVAEQASAKGVSLSCEADGEGLEASTDERVVRQVLINLLSNAVKFTLAGGAVIVAISRNEAGRIVIGVRDTGIGMNEADLARALEPFGQVESAYTRGNQGTGLGLPLCIRFAELIDAELDIESAPGQGTTVSLVLPPPDGRPALPAEKSAARPRLLEAS